jgi:polyferredoxin
MGKVKQFLKLGLWLFVSSIFIADLVKIVLDLSLVSGSAHQRFLTVFFRSSFGFFELIMGGLIIYFMIKYPERRLRLISVTFFHYMSVLALPIAFRDFTWMAVLYPWPHTLLAFDPKTTALVSTLSLFVGFIVIPVITFKWGAKGFCGYVCPHGAFYSEAYGRLFAPHPGKLKVVRKHFPPLYFLAMTAALGAIIIVPSVLEPVRQIQKVAFFLFSQFFYLIVAVPLIGPRSYCTHFCPIGYEVRTLVRLKSSYLKRQYSISGKG